MLAEPLESRRCLSSSLQPDLNYGHDGVGSAHLGQNPINLVDSYGRLVLLSTFGDVEPNPFNPDVTRVVRLNGHGKPDAAFNHGQAVELDGANSSATLQRDDKIICVAGNEVCRLTTDGQLDATFGDNGVVKVAYAQFSAVRVLADGKIRVLMGSSHLYQFNTDGTPDETFAPQGHIAINSGTFGALVPVQGFQQVYLDALGRPYLFLQEKNGLEAYLSRLDASGALDPAFGQDGLVDLGQSQRDSGRPIVEVTPLQLDFFSDNTLIVNIQPATLPETSHRLIRLNTDGSLATAFGDHGMSDFIAKAPVTQMNARVDLSSGQVYVSVYSQKPGQWEYAQSARLRNDGRIDKAYGHQQVFIDYVSPGGRLFQGSTRYVFRGPATLGSGNRLFIDGTSGDDTITLRGTRVVVNGEHFQFDVRHLTSITIQDGGGGNDRIISDANVPTNVTLSVGQSFIQTGSANDSINAGHFGDGRDTIFSGSGNDSIAAGNESYVDAGAGRDSITCAGGDTVFGGSGNDRIYVYGENPRSPAHISGGGGNDTIDLANGNTAYIDGKAGNDTVIVRFLCRALFLGGSGADTLLSDNNKLSNGGDLFYDVGPADVFREDVRNLPRI